MKKIVINGGKPLYGNISVSGMKNAALPIIFACILVPDKCVINNICALGDIITSLEILKSMGAQVNYLSPTSVEIDTRRIVQGSAPYDKVSKMRGSAYILGAELGRFGKASVGWPGGCDFGTRPIDQHIKGFNALGASCSISNGYVVADAPNGLVGNSVYFDVTSVGATANVILASVLADGLTVIDNAAREPHIVDLANFLNTCGANITGAGTSVIKIRGVSELHGCNYTIIPDMIEAGTYMVAAAATGGRVTINSLIPKHVETITAKLREIGVSVEEIDNGVCVSGKGEYKNTNIQTLPYPGFATDMHPQFAALLATSEGISSISETIWQNRFRYVDELLKMGACISVDARHATIVGKERLTGAPVNAVDLRAGAAMIIAGLAADGVTEISGVDMIERGYYDIVGKLRGVGADITIREYPDADAILMAN